MSIKIMVNVWKNQDEWLKGTRRLVLLALADNANDEGYCWPAIDTIAAKTNMGRRYIIQVLLQLEERKYIARQQRDGTSTVYHILQGGGVNPDSPQECTPIHSPVRPASLEPSLTIKEPRDKEEATTEIINAERIFTKACGMPTIPSTQLHRIGQIHDLAQFYGTKETEEAMRQAYQKWITTRTKDGRFYARTNLGWIDKAQEILAGGEWEPDAKSDDRSKYVTGEYADYVQH